jgi:hypothetical protein
VDKLVANRVFARIMYSSQGDLAFLVVQSKDGSRVSEESVIAAMYEYLDIITGMSSDNNDPDPTLN